MRKKTISIILLLSCNILFPQEQLQDLSRYFNDGKIVNIVSNQQLQSLVRNLSVRIIIQIGKNKQALLKLGTNNYIVKEKEKVYIPIKGQSSLKKNFEVLVINKQSVVLKHIDSKKNITIL